MKVTGIYFQQDQAAKMLATIKKALPQNLRRKLMPLIEGVMDDSGGRGLNGDLDTTSSVLSSSGYEITANVCCGGYAEVSVKKVTEKIIL